MAVYEKHQVHQRQKTDTTGECTKNINIVNETVQATPPEKTEEFPLPPVAHDHGGLYAVPLFTKNVAIRRENTEFLSSTSAQVTDGGHRNEPARHSAESGSLGATRNDHRGTV